MEGPGAEDETLNFKMIGNTMKRRKALTTIVWGSGALAALPYCSSNPYSVFDRLPFTFLEFEAILGISRAIVPERSAEFPTPEPRSTFLFQLLNDLLTAQEQEAFAEGVKAFLSKNPEFMERDPSAMEAILLTALSDSDEAIRTIKQFSLRHLMTTQTYMETVQGYEFIPGRFEGCVNIN